MHKNCLIYECTQPGIEPSSFIAITGSTQLLNLCYTTSFINDFSMNDVCVIYNRKEVIC